MRSVEFKVANETPEEQYEAQRWYPREDIYIKAFRRKLRLKSDHGSTDELYAFVEGETVYILSRNSGHGYIGLASFEKQDIIENGVRQKDGWWMALPTSNMFLDNDTDIVKSVGKKGIDLSPCTLVKRLKEDLPYE